jgi:hypothetical protein
MLSLHKTTMSMALWSLGTTFKEAYTWYTPPGLLLRRPLLYNPDRDHPGSPWQI